MSKFWIQKPTAHNCPIHSDKHVSQSAAVFQDFQPMLSMPHHEWIEVIPVASLASANKALDVAVKALEKAGGPDPLVGYAFDGNHQHKVLLEEICLRRAVATEALAEIKKIRGGE